MARHAGRRQMCIRLRNDRPVTAKCMALAAGNYSIAGFKHPFLPHRDRTLT
jgi:hypothetical protein